MSTPSGPRGGNEDSLAIVDVTNKSSTATLAELTYPNLGYTHQAWLDDSHRYLVVNDEFDEIDFGGRIATIVIDVTDLDLPSYLYTYRHESRSIDHNLFVIGNRIYQANYTSGLRILEFTSLGSDTLTEVGFFDTYPSSDALSFDGARGEYPFFSSGTVAIGDVSRGLFLLVSD